MFDVFSKLGEIKDKAAKLKDELEAKIFESTHPQNTVTVKTNGKKDVVGISLSDEFHKLEDREKERHLVETLQNAMKESESYAMSKLKSLVPNIPGLNLF